MDATPSRSLSERNTIRFVLDGEVIELRQVDPTLTVLTYLRETLRRTGTKEGCAEGNCGACTVVLADLRNQRVRFRAINACIQFVPTLDGKALITVESLRAPDGRLHPVQQAMVEAHASQCGFCTPGIVMSLFALYKSESPPSRQRLNDVLAGNLCRCTGYRPIIEAAAMMYQKGSETTDAALPWMHQAFSDADEVGAGERELVEQLNTLDRRTSLAIHGERHFIAPTTVDELAVLVHRAPGAHLLAGGTDVGLWVTKQHQDLEAIIYLGEIEALRRVNVTDQDIDVGAAVTLTEVYQTLTHYYPELDELLRRFASPPIRNVATLGGNIANGSPIGDSMPALIVLGARLILRHGDQRREIALEDFYLGYRHTALAPGEFIERIRIPIHVADHHVRAYKIAKRFDQDISAVCGAYHLTLEGNVVSHLRICYGGMAATPLRAYQCEQALIGNAWTEASVTAAMTRLDGDYTPLTDMRASEAYRRLVAKNLLRRFFLDTYTPASS
ncbi:xanthine dehydrogenase small subunit [Candidatus Entotheonella palauensis]|uniref:xanthine dehydrogenase small subunit n=1 Tax=Candidatus Entotheonella palauensis TaxID=93172 RepID=UPI00211736C2|nr:xanthine dehydrogenase small subunit [Candidatus Entotheonella palauensis]